MREVRPGAALGLSANLSVAGAQAYGPLIEFPATAPAASGPGVGAGVEAGTGVGAGVGFGVTITGGALPLPLEPPPQAVRNAATAQATTLLCNIMRELPGILLWACTPLAHEQALI